MNSSSSESGQNKSLSSNSSKSEKNEEFINKKRKRKNEPSQKNSPRKNPQKKPKRKEHDKKQVRQNIKDESYEKEKTIEIKEKEEKKDLRKEDKTKKTENTKDSSGSNDERNVDSGKSVKSSPENSKEENVQITLENIKEILNNKFNEISNQFNDKDKTINELNKKVEGLNKKVEGLNKKVGGLEKDVKEHRVKFDLMNEIYNQTEIYNNTNFKILNSRINALVNAFKILFIRKLSNILFQKLVEKYKNDLAKTKKIFGQDPKFGIIVAQNNINNIKKFEINILIDYLKFIKQFASRIIHLRDLNKVYCQKEIFYQLLNIYIGNKSEEKTETVDTSDIINIIFIPKKINNDESSSKTKESQLEKLINEYIGKEKDKENVSKNEKEKSDKKKELDKKGKETKEESEEEKEFEEEVNLYEDLDEEKLKNIMEGKESKKSLKVVDLLVKLKKKIKINQNNSKINILKNTEINPNPFPCPVSL